MIGEVRLLHRNAPGPSFQVASQFNLLEMLLPDVTPEHGATRHQGHPTQGPAYAIAAGAATICGNYLVPVHGGAGQTADRQLDELAEVGAALQKAAGRPVGDLWAMRNGYALCTLAVLDAIATHLASAGKETVDALRGRLRISMHRDVEVTNGDGSDRLVVSQALCSALLIAYGQGPGGRIERRSAHAPRRRPSRA